MLHQLKGRLTSTTRRVVSALTLAFLFLSSTVQAQQPSEPARLPCGTLCIVIIIFIIIVILIIIYRWWKGRKG